jgi:Protein of unknown function DUF72
LAPASVTAPSLARGVAAGRDERRQGSRANPRFLDPYAFLRDFLPTVRSSLGAKLGPVLLVFPECKALSPELFMERLARFSALLPDTIDWGVELREARMFGDAYIELLATTRLSHVFTTWPGMPSLEEQHQRVPPPRVGVVHLCSVPRARPEEPAAKAALRAGVTRLTMQLAPVPSFVLASDGFEGSAPLTLIELARDLVRASAGLPPLVRPQRA